MVNNAGQGRMNNSDVVARMLERAGVRWVFGIPSGPVLPLIEALRRTGVEFVLTASESSAAFMAATVGYLTGVPGVCVATVGPGATNLTTGVGCAWLDRCPLIAITCNVASSWRQRRIQMRIDHHALFKPLTKATFPLRAGAVGKTVATALGLACNEPPGPVHLDFPEDTAIADGIAYEEQPRSAAPLSDLAPHLCAATAEALNNARRPLVVTGLTFTRAQRSDKLLRFIERQNLPFVTTLHAKGFLPESHSHWAGVIGRARRTDVKAFTDKADLIIAVGYDPIEMNYEEWAGDTPLIHVSTEAAEGGDRLRLLWNSPCDLDRAIDALGDLEPSMDDWSAGELASHRHALERALRPAIAGFTAQQVFDIAREKLPRYGLLSYDVGAHTHQIATQWRTDEPKTMLATNGWSSMGYGMPAAYAAKLIHSQRPVICIVGDGGFQMTAGELALARRLKLAVPVIVLNDGWLGLMKIKQERKHYALSGVCLGDPVEPPAHYFGVPCRAARSAQDFRAALDWAMSFEGPTVIEAFINPESYSATVFD
jgi:acetolactate synthase-1/2/3 large subunit